MSSTGLSCDPNSSSSCSHGAASRDDGRCSTEFPSIQKRRVSQLSNRPHARLISGSPSARRFSLVIQHPHTPGTPDLVLRRRFRRISQRTLTILHSRPAFARSTNRQTGTEMEVSISMPWTGTTNRGSSSANVGHSIVPSGQRSRASFIDGERFADLLKNDG